mgnify:CR=1 FL=1
MEQAHVSTAIAGIDVGKRWLDAALDGVATPPLRIGNDKQGIAKLGDWLREHRVGRVGLEASGPYDRLVRCHLEAAGFEVVVHQPLEVRLFGRLKRQRAKSDRLDARLIAAATAGIDRQTMVHDPRLAELAERFTVYERIAEAIAGFKNLLESVTLADLRRSVLEQIEQLKLYKAELVSCLMAAVEVHADLRSRLGLLLSLPGFGSIVAASMLVRMPELGHMQHGQPAALIGTAPYDRDSGRHVGQRCIAGGRSRPRRMLYIAALSARRCDPHFKAFADRLERAGKPKKVIIVAVMRKLIEAANLVLKRAQPWTPATP